MGRRSFQSFVQEELAATRGRLPVFCPYSGLTMRKTLALIAALLLAGFLGCGSPTGQGVNRDKDKPVRAGRAEETKQAP